MIHALLPERFYDRAPPDLCEQLAAFRAAHPWQTRQIDGVDWSYLAAGQGPATLLLLPGGTRTGEAWWRLIALLDNRYRIIAPTYPAIGSLGPLVEGLSGLLRGEGVEAATVVGTSFGGMVAQWFVRRFPASVDRLVLSNTAAPDPRYGRKAAIGAALVRLFPAVLVRRAALRRAMREPHALPDDERAFLYGFLSELYHAPDYRQATASIYRCMTEFSRARLAPDDLRAWKGEILIVETADDHIFDAAARASLRALYPTARVHTLPGGGHSPAWNRPQAYARVLREFLGEVDAGQL